MSWSTGRKTTFFRPFSPDTILTSLFLTEKVLARYSMSSLLAFPSCGLETSFIIKPCPSRFISFLLAPGVTRMSTFIALETRNAADQHGDQVRLDKLYNDDEDER